jgi:acetylglutamate kinase
VSSRTTAAGRGSETQQGAGSGAVESTRLPPGARERAGILVEALPYIRRFWGKRIVVKYGGNTLSGSLEEGDTAALASFAEDVVLMRSVGMLPVVVHGGGPQIGELMSRLGKVPEFRDGMRVTDAETLEIARMVLVGKVNREIVSAINLHGPLAIGLSGEDANLMTAAARPGDLGFVGDVEGVDPSILERLLAEGLIPVVATVAADPTGQAYNINADSVAGALAVVLGAEKLVFLTDTEGLRADAGDARSLLRTVGADQLDEMVSTGAASGGMIPKVEACARAVRGGVGRAHILDGRVPHALLLEIFTDEGVGTMVEQTAKEASRR